MEETQLSENGSGQEESSIDKELEDVLIQSIEENSLLQEQPVEAPKELLILPILRRPFFPGMAAPIVIEPGPFYEMLKLIAKSAHKSLGLFLTKEEEADPYKVKLDDLYRVGVLGRILRIIPLEQGGAQVIFNMEKRAVIEKPARKGKLLKARVSYYEETQENNKEMKAYAISIISTIKELLKLNPLFKEELQIFLRHSDFTEPATLADFAVALTTASREDLQEVLETLPLRKRIDKALVLLKKELDLSRLQHTLSQKIEATISKSQKEYYLREQLKTIKKELGIDRDDKIADREKFEKRLKKRVVPKEVETVIQEELEKLGSLETQSAEYAISRGYLDWLTVVPWGIFSRENHDLKKAKRILEEDHYGLENTKKRILEFMGVGKLTGRVRGSIICLVGPPGVGKTSIGRSIARALNRKFYRFSVGGMRDEAEIKGHRRTYIGAMPGKLIQALKFCKTMNPVIMLDEVDKMGSNYHGDPASALLEVLDPEQNQEFLDHYLDVRCDLSNILFIVTANVLDTIPEPLKDRMDILRLSGYIVEEKIEIAKKHLIPRSRKESGLKAKEIVFSPKGLEQIINGYAREAGVRGLENQIKKIMRKTAVALIEYQEKAKRSAKPKPAFKQHVNPKNLEELLGKPTFTSEKYYKINPIGVATGLAWTALGGAILYIECIKIPAEKTGMHLTGQAGDVMKESSQIAWSYLQSALHKYAAEHTFFEKYQVHIHIPEGATPKDGPSAGITMVTALLSLLLDAPISEGLGMTGELTLTGRILPIGGVKEKIVAAKRAGLSTLIFPRENESDVQELPDYVKKGLSFHFLEHYDQVFEIAFPSFPLGGLP